MTSIRRTLLAWLLAGLAVVAMLATVLTYVETREEVGDLFDLQLKQLAYSTRIDDLLRGRQPSLTLPDGPPGVAGVSEIVTQIWDRDGVLVYWSRPGAGLPVPVTEGYSNVMQNGREWRVYTHVAGNHALQVAHALDERREIAAQIALRTLLPFAALIPLLGILIWYAVGFGLRPLDTMSRAVAKRRPEAMAPLAEGGLPTELTPLAGSLNALLARLDEALAAQRRFTADAAHELRTPLAALKLQVDLAERASDPATRESAFAELKAGVDRAAHLVEQLLMMARLEPEATARHVASVDLPALAKDAIVARAALAADKRVDLGLAAQRAGRGARRRGEPCDADRESARQRAPVHPFRGAHRRHGRGRWRAGGAVGGRHRARDPCRRTRACVRALPSRPHRVGGKRNRQRPRPVDRAPDCRRAWRNRPFGGRSRRPGVGGAGLLSSREPTVAGPLEYTTPRGIGFPASDRVPVSTQFWSSHSMSKRTRWARLMFLSLTGCVLASAPAEAARKLPTIDALAAASVAPARKSAAVGALESTAPGANLEPNLPVPTFLWGSQAGTTMKALGVTPSPKAAQDAESTARGYLADVADLYRITAAEIAALPMHDLQRFPGGGSIARFRGQVAGIEVFREQVNVLVDKRGALVAIGGFAMGAPAGAQKSAEVFARSPEAAVAAALADFGFGGDVARRLTHMQAEGGYTAHALPAEDASDDGATLVAARSKPVWFRLPGDLVPARYIEVQVRDGAWPHDVDAYAYVISARDGTTLFRHSQSADAFTYRAYAEPASPFLPLPGPAGRAGFPNASGTPDGFQPAPQPGNLVTVESAPFSKNDPWLVPNANRTFGNNVEAFIDILTPDNFGTPGTDECNVSLPVDGDLHACLTSPGTFDHPYDFTKALSASRSQTSAAVTNLFYVNNFLHDWYYDAGFDEAAGNAQTNNYGRGGLGNDSIFAEAQDFAGTNNANMTVPADGARPRMRMYRWTSSIALVKVTAPPPIAGAKQAGTAEFGPSSFDLTGLTRARHRRGQHRRPDDHGRLHGAHQRGGGRRQDRARGPRRVHLRRQGQERAERGRGRRGDRQ